MLDDKPRLKGQAINLISFSTIFWYIICKSSLFSSLFHLMRLFSLFSFQIQDRSCSLRLCSQRGLLKKGPIAKATLHHVPRCYPLDVFGRTLSPLFRHAIDLSTATPKKSTIVISFFCLTQSVQEFQVNPVQKKRVIGKIALQFQQITGLFKCYRVPSVSEVS